MWGVGKRDEREGQQGGAVTVCYRCEPWAQSCSGHLEGLCGDEGI